MNTVSAHQTERGEHGRKLGTLTNLLGTAVFTDAEAKNSSQKFYRAYSQ